MPTLSFELPLLRRELLGLVRSRRTFWMLVLAVAVSSLVPLVSWASAADGVGKGSGNARVVATFLVTQLVVVLVTVTSLMADSIAGERERGTLDVLVATRLSPASIVLSKLAASLVYVAILLVASAPSACVLHLQGGVAIGSILQSYAVTFAAASVAACVTIDQSARSPRTSHATGKGLASIAGWTLIPTVLVFALPSVLGLKTPYERAGRFYSRRRGSLLAAILVGLFLLTWILLIRLGPIVFYVSLMWRPRFLWWGLSPFTLIRSAVFNPVTDDWVVYTGVVVAICMAYCWRAARQLPLEVLSTPKQAGKPLSPAAAARFRAAGRRLARSRLVRRLVKKGSTTSAWLGNPVFQREISTELHGSAMYLLASFAFSLLFLLLLALIAFFQHWGAIRTVCAAASLLCLFATSTAAATSIPREIAQGNLDFLRCTRLTPREILTGKLLAGLHAAIGIFAATVTTLALSVFGVFNEPISLSGMTQCVTTTVPSLLLLLLMIVYGATAGTLASVVESRALPALLVAYGLLSVPVVMFLWPPENALRLNPSIFLAVCIFVVVARGLWLFACWWFERFRMRDR